MSTAQHQVELAIDMKHTNISRMDIGIELFEIES